MLSQRDEFYKSQALNDINITPLVDVTMVMLIIFILIAPVIEQGITVKLPETSARTMAHEESVTISLSEDKKIFIGNTAVTLPQLEERLISLRESVPNLPVVLRADKGLAYEFIVKVLDTIQKAGITKLGLATSVERVK
ncbi:MAG: biopolymer transporter ExbD [Candidatus Auribacterota bacterium]|jgi:biopolymer transport protein TolR|uniref:Biopolymer transporter ExbD n=1 Tax=Candidatus Auribacter fodinae TaxID=2093366 RepID=A0A3A4QWI3_9BACT|nr:MAG: biopolymer transporter ExbD [Candidatus Auribacter fodinae]